MIDLIYAVAKVQGGKKFTAVHPLVEEVRQARIIAERQGDFLHRIENGSKANPLSKMPGARKPVGERKHYVPGATPDA